MRKMAPINIIVHYPQTEEGKKELAERVATAHASAVNQKLRSLNCPERQKLELLDAIIRTKKEECR